MTVLRNISVQPMGRRVTEVLASGIESPNSGDSSATTLLQVNGWVIGHAGPVSTVEAFSAGRRLASASVDLQTPHLAERFGAAGAWATTAGFAMNIETLGLDPAVDIRIRAMEGATPLARIATITATRMPISPAVTPRINRLLVTTIGRTGSTLLMRLLAAHPEIVAFQRDRHEVRAAKYWLHVLAALSTPGPQEKRIGSENEFHLEPFVAGIPFLNPGSHPFPESVVWANTDYRSLLADFVITATEGWYAQVAAAQEQGSPTFWAEKAFPDQYATLAREVWPTGKEVILVRDFRDMWASMRSYNALKGRADFGRSEATSEESWLTSMGHGAIQLAETATRQAGKAHVVRYEDLVQHPDITLTNLLSYLGLATSPEVIGSMRAAATTERIDLVGHVTAGSVDASIGRWRRDLRDEDLAIAKTVLAQPLAAFGYDPT